jgi:type VI secretion system protein ImpG
MNSDLLEHYNRELQYLREMGGEFARAYPKIAGRLGLDDFECADPYVERLLEGVSFLCARVQLKLDASFPQMSQHLLEHLHSDYLAPTPSMAIARFHPDPDNPQGCNGTIVPRHTVLHSRPGPHSDTRCTVRTAHALQLAPLELTAASTYRFSGLATQIHPRGLARPPQGVIHLRLRAIGMPAQALELDTLPLYLPGSDGQPERLHEYLLSQPCAAVLRFGPPGRETIRPLPAPAGMGLDDDQALLPDRRNAFSGFRLLQEYFAFPQRHLFVRQDGLRAALGGNEAAEFDIFWFFERHDEQLEPRLDASRFTPFATPVINLFPQRAARIELTDERFEHHIVADPARPLDLEICHVEAVRGYNAPGTPTIELQPFYYANDRDGLDAPTASYQLHRVPRLPSARQRRDGHRTRYLGSETFIALSDAPPLRQLGLDVLCSNRDLPLAMPVGGGPTDFIAEKELPVAGIRCLSGPSRPRPMLADNKVAWRLINHLTLDYLALAHTRPEAGIAALHRLLELYCPPADPAGRRQIQGLCGLSARPATRRLPGAGPLAWARGTELTLTFDDAAFEGGSAFLLACVLEQFFARQAPINSFCATIANSQTRGEILRRPPGGGQWPTL